MAEVSFAYGKTKNKRISPNKYAVSQKDSSLFLITYIDNVPFEKFKIISIDTNKEIGENAFIITLVRLKLK